MSDSSRCHNEGCSNFAGSDGQCNACRRGDKPDTEKRKREEEATKNQEERASQAKRRKREETRARRAPCVKCGGIEILELYNKAPDNNYYTLPSGESEDSGGGFVFPALTHHEGMEMSICVDCGTVVGFDSAALKAAVAEAEELALGNL